MVSKQDLNSSQISVSASDIDFIKKKYDVKVTDGNESSQ